MNQVLGLVRSLHSAAEVFVISAPTVVEAAFNIADRPTHNARLEQMGRRVVEHAQADLTIDGREHLLAAPDETFVVMSNHRSHIDIPVLLCVFAGRCLRMVAKSEIFRIPIFGGAMRTAGFIAINRGNRAEAIATLKAARATLDSGVDVWIAPEGTRSRDGKLGPFKSGGFHMALDTERRILPIAIRGTEQVIPTHSILMSTGAKIDVLIGAPIATAPYRDDHKGLMALVRSEMEAMLAR